MDHASCQEALCILPAGSHTLLWSNLGHMSMAQIEPLYDGGRGEAHAVSTDARSARGSGENAGGDRGAAPHPAQDLLQL